MWHPLCDAVNRLRVVSLIALAAAIPASASGQSAPPPPPPVPPVPVLVRDVLPGQVNQAPEPAGTGVIIGVITSAATGQPVDGVRVTLSGTILRGSRQIVSDDDGRFGFMNLPAGEFTLRAAKTGYVSVAYGQKEPRAGWPGTPIALADGQQIKNLSVSLPPGGVITGAVFDEKNRPSVATPVRVLRWSIQGGDRVLASVGSATTDDRGIYRVYGLSPGDYVVTAMPRNSTSGEFAYSIADLASVDATMRVANVSVAAAGGAAEPFVMIRTDPTAAPGNDAPADGYAPVYYPGTPMLSGAATVTLRASEERGGVDVRLVRVPMTRIVGQVLLPPGTPVTNVQLRLVNTAEQVPGVSTQTARAGSDGRFRFTSVPPGQYRIVATADVRETTRTAGAPGQPGRTVTTTRKLWAANDVSVGGGSVADVVLALAPGFSVSGRVIFEPGQTPMPTDLRRVRLTLAPHGPLASASGAATVATAVDAEGRFSFANVLPGSYRLRSAGGVSGWTIKSALAGGTDAVDFPLEVGQGADVSNMLVTFSDRTSGMAGVVQDAMGRPTADHTVILFPAQEQFWIPQSRRIQAARPTTAGRFTFSGLPAGEYRLAAVTDVEPGTWYDPAFLRQLLSASIAVSLAEGQTRTQDLKVGR